MDTATFVNLLQKCGLMADKRLERKVKELAGSAANGRSLARELIQRDLLTPYQANQLLTGKAQALVLGQYRLMERLSQGSMGQTFKAVHVAMGRVVTIKVLAPHVAQDPQIRARFTREVHNLAQLTHPNILAAFDAFEDEGVYVLVMEYVEGMDLVRLVSHTGPLPVPLACSILRQTALGLQHAFERGLTCCHIRPDSILVAGYQAKAPASDKSATSSAVPRGAVKIVDLGLSPLGETTPVAKLSEVLEWPEHLAPEEMKNHQLGDIGSDIYRMGCILFFALTGKLTLAENDPARSLSRLRNDIPVPLVAVVKRMLAPNPAERYRTPGEVATDLAGFCSPGVLPMQTL
jgi:serine/threonine protein kinase